ncbi:MAG TPA: PrsW family glutamic-type intramembrane protease [Candidatus Angelobacter sp.]|nr:PrsW family glutamic-type intramembrane protease [Candidatus Angelobacter sp.]
MAGRGSADSQPLNPAARPRRAHYLICLGMGATVGFVAAFGESFYAPLAFPVLIFNQALFSIAVAVAVAPLVEEPAKSLGLLLFKEEEKLSFKIADWAVLGSLSGIGFGFMENVVYALGVLGYGVNVSLSLFLMRGLLTPPLHGITATLTGFGIGLWQKTGNARLFVIPLIAAMVIHGSFNLLASII